MSWNFDDITRDWLGESAISPAPEEIVDAFERCERTLGRDWIMNSRGAAIGAIPTLRVVNMGRWLASLYRVADTKELIDKLIKSDPSAIAEVQAIYLIRPSGFSEVELFPPVAVCKRERKADFRIRASQSAWVYVEVTQPDMADSQHKAKAILGSLIDLVELVNKPFDLEVFLRREPTEAETAAAREFIFSYCQANTSGTRDLPDGLGMLFLREAPQGPITLEDHGEEPRPRLGIARVVIGNDIPARRISVRIPYSDERAEALLRREAAQLPPSGPGLIMIGVGNAPGAVSRWKPLIQRRFQPAINTRISGVCLFSGGILSTPNGFNAVPQTSLIINPYAIEPLPKWVLVTLNAASAEFRGLDGR